MDYVKEIQLADLELNDSIFDAGSLITEHDGIFTFHERPTRILPYQNLFHNSVTFELSDTRTIFYRTVYSFLDWLRDLGGLYGAISAICIAMVFVF